MKAKDSWDRAKAKVTTSGEMNEYQKEKGEIGDKINDYFAKAMEDSNNYNSDYFKITGANVSGYDVNDLYWIVDYNASFWASITPAGSSLYLQLGSHTNLNPIVPQDFLYVLSVLSNSGSILNHIINSKMINGL